LRCRPEAAPELGAWRGTSNTVSRALALIDSGALDAADVGGLADRLGMGERQLRRLFRQHLGASPIAVAQTRRVLLAKQLIHETRLPMGEIALAAGFSSVRRFNETFQSLYRRPPAALRRAGTAPAAGPGEEIRLTLAYRAPYDWDALIGFLAARAIAGVEAVTARHYCRSIRLGGEVGLVRVWPSPGDRLSVAIRFPRLCALPSILARVRRIFDLSADPQAIAEHLGRDPALAPRAAARPGLRVPGAWDGFELAIRAILGQQISVAAATALAARIVRDHGESLPGAMAGAMPGVTHVFPSAEALARADLAALPMPRARSSALSALARAAATDGTLFEPAATAEDAVRRLRALPGIGEWTAQYIALRTLREPDAFPAADIGLQRALADRAGVRPSAGALLARAEAWRPWRGYAALHLWTTPDPIAGAADDRTAAAA
jgi:AraC family transcriptional regulator of adaptative response / DNA-3-methyladenine glycosylase II